MTDEELDALVHDIDHHSDNISVDEPIIDRILAAITTLRAQLAKAQAERDQMRSAIFGSSDYAPDLKCGNFVEMAQTLHAAQKGGLDRADRAEAALAAQIEVDAGIVQRFATGHFAEGMVLERAALNRAAAIIRNQPHDRTALDRYREKALREAAEILDDEGWLGMSKHRILALIEKEKTE